MKLFSVLCILWLGSQAALAQAKVPNAREHIGLNFMRPDANRPGNYDFVNHGPWLVGEFKKLGVKWNRVAFSWVVIQPEEKRYDWSAYDRIVDACEKNGIEILATLGGHFDRPPVLAWAGATLAEVVEKNPAALEAFIRAWVQRYQGRIHYFEILNEPKVHHQRLTVKSYVEGVLRPAYRIVKILLKNPSGQKVTVKKTISDVSPGNSNRVQTKLARKNSRHFSCIFAHLQKGGVLQQNQ